MAAWGGAGHGKSGASLARGCFLLLLLLLWGEARALTAPNSGLALGSSSVKFRGSRSALMHPTAVSYSPSNKRQRQPSQQSRGGSSSSNSMHPSAVSLAPSTRSQVPSPAITPAPHTPRTHTWASRGGSWPPQPTFSGFGWDRATNSRTPGKRRRPQGSHTHMEGGGGWAGMNAPAVQGRWMSQPRPQHTPDLAHPATSPDRQDTYGVMLNEDLSHLEDRTLGRRQPEPVVNKSPVGGEDRVGSRGTTHTVFNGGSHRTHFWPTEEVKEEGEVDEEGGRSFYDFNATSEYQPDDYNAYHEYDHGNTWRTSEHTPSTATVSIPMTTTSPPLLSHLPNMPDRSAVDADYQGDVTRQPSLPATDTESEDDDTNLESRERSRKNRKKGRRGNGGRRKNRRRKGRKGRKKDQSDIGGAPNPQVDNTTQTPVSDPWLPSTPKTLPEIIFTTTTATRGIQLPITQPPTPGILTTSPSFVKASDVSIVSVTLVEAPSDPQPETPGQTTFVEGAPPSRKQNNHSTTILGEERNPRKTLHPVRTSPGPEQTIIEEVNFVREKQRDDYVFPLRGLLIISGLMGALAVFTLVVLISYAVIKCSKKPVVNNYQVSEQQKPAGT